MALKTSLRKLIDTMFEVSNDYNGWAWNAERLFTSDEWFYLRKQRRFQ